MLTSAVHRWAYIVHLRKQDEGDIIEISGTFAGTYMQTFTHIQALARQHEATVVNHSVKEIGQTPPVIHRNQAQSVVKALPPPPKREPAESPAPPEGCEWAEKHVITTQEYSNHGKASRNDSSNRLH